MKVILTEKVKSLGNVGEIINVSPGYARNYLLPKNVAVVADEKNKSAFENQQKALAKKVAEQKSAAEIVANKLNGLQIELIKKVGSNGRLFGTVTNTELAKVLSEKDFDVERRQILIETPIKSTGDYTIKVKLFTGVEAEFKVKVSMDPKQAEEMKKKAEAAAKKKKEAKAKAETEAAEGSEATEEASANSAESTETTTEA